jgi:hypothetical protein
MRLALLWPLQHRQIVFYRGNHVNNQSSFLGIVVGPVASFGGTGLFIAIIAINEILRLTNVCFCWQISKTEIKIFAVPYCSGAFVVVE